MKSQLKTYSQIRKKMPRPTIRHLSKKRRLRDVDVTAMMRDAKRRD